MNRPWSNKGRQRGRTLTISRHQPLCNQGDQRIALRLEREINLALMCKLLGIIAPQRG
jgi:hypothetical protein